MSVSTISRHLQSLNIPRCYSVTIFIYWSSPGSLCSDRSSCNSSRNHRSQPWEDLPLPACLCFQWSPFDLEKCPIHNHGVNTQTIVPASYDCRWLDFVSRIRIMNKAFFTVNDFCDNPLSEESSDNSTQHVTVLIDLNLFQWFPARAGVVFLMGKANT